MMVSASPPEFPSAQNEYESAVSMKFPPISTYPSRIRWETSTSAVQPKTLVPSTRGATLICCETASCEDMVQLQKVRGCARSAQGMRGAPRPDLNAALACGG